MNAVMVMTTVGQEGEGHALAERLIEKKLAACVSIQSPCTSIYTWKGKVEKEREFILVIKSVPDRLDPLVTEIRNIHPYECPEILRIDADSVNPGYTEWLKEQTRE